MEFGQLDVFGVVVVPLILGLVSLAKEVGFPAKFAPLLAVALGVLTGVFLLYPDDPH